ncbi:hypothetical protein BVY01_00575 [bacterium I07]|nr:hypothetical protein BVY01_00575 [bacterium I07]
MNTAYVKRGLVLITVLILMGSLSCGRGDSDSQSGPTIALVMKTLNNLFFIDMERGAQAEAKRLNVNLVVQAAEREVDVEKQMQIIENLIQRRVDVIIVAPSGSKEIIPAIVKANKAGIPVLGIDTRIDPAALKMAGGELASFIGSDNFEGGKIAGQHIAELLDGKGEVAILEGIPGHETGDERKRGFHEALAGFPEIKVIASLTANWERDQGFNVFQSILQSHPGVDALFACNDLMALGAIEAIRAAGRDRDVIVVGFDAILDAKNAIKDGSMKASVAQHPDEMGRAAVEIAFKLLNNQEIPTDFHVNIELVTIDKL